MMFSAGIGVPAFASARSIRFHNQSRLFLPSSKDLPPVRAPQWLPSDQVARNTWPSHPPGAGGSQDIEVCRQQYLLLRPSRQRHPDSPFVGETGKSLPTRWSTIFLFLSLTVYSNSTPIMADIQHDNNRTIHPLTWMIWQIVCMIFRHFGFALSVELR